MIKFHPSSLGLIMTDAQSVDRALVPAELLEVCDKARKTDTDRAALLPYKEASLSATAKTYLNSLAKQEVYGYRKVLDVKYLSKGLELEAVAIQMLNDLEFKSYVKNDKRLENDFLTGEPDIIVPGVRTIDTKVSWSLDTFPAVSEDAHDPMYEWQGRGYMQLCDVQEHRVSYLMLDTPEDMRRWEQPELHIVSHIPPELRHTSITYQRCMVLEAKMNAKLATARAYLLRRIELIHAERIPKPIISIGATMQPTTAPTAAPTALPTEAPPAAAVIAPAALEVRDIAPSGPPTLRLGQISERLGFTITADFLSSLGFAPAATDKNAKLYHDSDFPSICAALLRHIQAVSVNHTSKGNV